MTKKRGAGTEKKENDYRNCGHYRYNNPHPYVGHYVYDSLGYHPLDNGYVKEGNLIALDCHILQHNKLGQSQPSISTTF